MVRTVNIARAGTQPCHLQSTLYSRIAIETVTGCKSWPLTWGGSHFPDFAGVQSKPALFKTVLFVWLDYLRERH